LDNQIDRGTAIDFHVSHAARSRRHRGDLVG